MTIIFATPVFLPDLPGGFRRFFHYAPGLRERGIRMKVFTVAAEGKGEMREEINTIEIISCNIDSEDHLVVRQKLTERALEEAYANQGGEKQIVFPIAFNWAVARLFRKARKNGISIMRFVTTAPELPHGKWRRIKRRISSSLIHTSFEKLIYCSGSQVEVHRSACWIQLRKTVVVPNGINSERFHPPRKEEKEELRRNFGVSLDETVFLYVGNVIPRKGIDFLIRSWKQVQESCSGAKLIIVGNRNMPDTFLFQEDKDEFELFQERMERALGDLGAAKDSVLFEPPTDRVEDWLKLADAFVFPSYCEGLPNALIEAMACGLPCITAPFAGFPEEGEELGNSGKEFLLVPHDEELWTREICELVEDAEKRRELGEAAHHWIASVHDYNMVLDKLAGVLQAACDSEKVSEIGI